MLAAYYPRWFLFYGALAVAIGMLHNLATSGVYRTAVALMKPALAVKVGYFFAAMGTAVILCGVLLIVVTRGLREGDRLARRVAWCSLAYLLVALVAAAACGIVNRYCLALIVGAVVSSVVLACWRGERRSPAC